MTPAIVASRIHGARLILAAGSLGELPPSWVRSSSPNSLDDFSSRPSCRTAKHPRRTLPRRRPRRRCRSNGTREGQRRASRRGDGTRKLAANRPRTLRYRVLHHAVERSRDAGCVGARRARRRDRHRNLQTHAASKLSRKKRCEPGASNAEFKSMPKLGRNPPTRLRVLRTRNQRVYQFRHQGNAVPLDQTILRPLLHPRCLRSR